MELTNSRTGDDFLKWLISVNAFDEIRISDDNRCLDAYKHGEKIGGIVIRQDKPDS